MKAIEIAKAPEIGVSRYGQSTENVSVRPSRSAPEARPRAKPSAPKANGSVPELTGPQQRIIASLALWHSIGHDTPSREQVAAVASYRPGSGGLNNLLGGLRSAGAIDHPSGGRVSLLLAIDAPMSPGAARDMLLSILTGPQRKVVEAVRVMPHVLRHTCATWALRGGLPIWDVAALLGTSAAMIERTYGHHSPDFQSGVSWAFYGRGTGTRGAR